MRAAPDEIEHGVEAVSYTHLQELLKDQDVIELVDVEYVKEHDWYLRVYIDKEGGIDIEDCQALSEKMCIRDSPEGWQCQPERQGPHPRRRQFRHRGNGQTH